MYISASMEEEHVLLNEEERTRFKFFLHDEARVRLKVSVHSLSAQPVLFSICFQDKNKHQAAYGEPIDGGRVVFQPMGIFEGSWILPQDCSRQDVFQWLKGLCIQSQPPSASKKALQPPPMPGERDATDAPDKTPMNDASKHRRNIPTPRSAPALATKSVGDQQVSPLRKVYLTGMSYRNR